MGYFLVKYSSFRVSVLRYIVDRAPRRYLYARTRLCLWSPKARKAISSC